MKKSKQWFELVSAMVPINDMGEVNHYGNNTYVDVIMDTDQNKKDPRISNIIDVGTLHRQSKPHYCSTSSTKHWKMWQAELSSHGTKALDFN